MADFEINGTAYQSKLMDGETQTLVLKRLLPTFTALVGVSTAAAGEDDDPRGRMSALLLPVAERLADIADADVAFILNACLDVTSRPAARGTGRVGVRQRGIVQDQADAKFVVRLQIAYHVLAENFGDMLTSLGVDLEALKAAAPPLG